MELWKRRLAFVVAVGAGGLALTLSSAGAQTPPSIPDFPGFTFPTFPDFPTIPTIPGTTTPPPTMPPPTSPTTTPPPTMPPPTTTPPPTMPPPTSTPPSSVPNIDDFFEDFFDRLEQLADDSPFEELRQVVDDIIADFRN